MKKEFALPLVSVLGGAIALALRLVQNHTGFEADTGLPVPGAPAGIVLAIFLLALVITLFLLARQLPSEAEQGPAFSDVFSTSSTELVTLLIMGIFLIGISGCLDIFFTLFQRGVTGEGLYGVSPASALLRAVTALITAVSLFPTAAACRRSGNREKAAAPRKKLDNDLLLVPAVCLVVRLVLAYREDSVNPVLEAYYVELLALVFLALAFYRLSSFAFRAGRTRRFALYAGIAIALCTAALADGHRIDTILLYGGCALTLLAFLLMAVLRPVPKPHSPEPENND